MTDRQGVFFAIDLKSFYASVECRDRGLDPMTTNLVVADPSRTEMTICLAVSPSLKQYGIPGRARLFEVVERVSLVNAKRRSAAPGHVLAGESSDDIALRNDSCLALSYIVAPPRMTRYMEVSASVYQVYLKYFAPEDIHPYSIDEVFIDATNYIRTYGVSPHDLVRKIIQDVLQKTGITATAGIGTNLYLSKVAMDVVAKHVDADADGVRIAELDEMSYRRQLWTHRPLTDFWRVGRGYAKKLEAHGLFTMGDIARCSVGKPGDYYNEELLYKLFGVNAELLIDHAWAYEPCTMADIKAYKPESNSICSGQVLQSPYDFFKGMVVVREMAESMALDLVEKGLVTDQIVLTVGYDIENLSDPDRRAKYKGPTTKDRYGREIPKHAHGTENLRMMTSSTKTIVDAALSLYRRILDPDLLIRRVTVTANHVVSERDAASQAAPEQLDLFTDPEAREREAAARERERRQQQAMLDIRKRFGKNAILKGTDFEEGATTRERNNQIGGHKA